MGKLDQKIAVITGGNSGIGLASARRFKEEGATVIINARNQKRLAETRAELGDQFDILQADVTNLADLDRFYATIKEKYGRIDVLFLNAGIAPTAPVTMATEAHFDQLFDVNVKGVYFGVQKALDLLADGASVIITTSVVNQKGMAGMSVYSATKAAVRSFARTLSAELAPRGIRVNALSPGPIETPLLGKMGLDEETAKGFAQVITQKVPLARFGSAEEIAKPALFLASDDSSYVAGEELVVDGGMAFA
ncbi:MAG: SDR family oxidoreductase [Bacteroidota bacterium]